MDEIFRRLAGIEREVFAGAVDGQEVIGARLRRVYAAPRRDVWEALTDPDRLRRWFLPLPEISARAGRSKRRATSAARSDGASRPTSSS